METKTTTKAEEQSSAEQNLNSPVETALFTSPTMTFGEVGVTNETETDTYEARAHGVGHFPHTEMLTRMVNLGTFSWNTTDTGFKFTVDVNNLLKSNAKNAAVLSQFAYYRPEEIEITARLNSSNFYIGALMFALYPEGCVDDRDSLAVMDPSVVSACCAEAIVKSIKYPFPEAWLRVQDNNPVFLSAYVLHPLRLSTDTAANAITATLWGRYKKIELSYPIEAQSGKTTIARPKGKPAKHPAQDKEAESGPLEILPALISSTVSEMGASALSDLALGALALVDKPDYTEPVVTVQNDSTVDMYASDIPDSNPSWSIGKQRYVDPGKNRLPSSGDWTVPKYSQIPGLKAVFTFTDVDNTQEFYPLGHLTNYQSARTPLDYALASSLFWRGSAKLLLQFFTSSFTSARFVLEYINENDGTFPTSYDNGISRVIDVKGDTVEKITLPYMNTNWWSRQCPLKCRLKVISNIAGSDPAVNPIIYCSAWVAGGDDIQFAFPIVPEQGAWPWRAVPQSAIGKLFQEDFPPITEDIVYDTDEGLCTNEALGSITDLCKRYSPIQSNPNWDSTSFEGRFLDYLCNGTNSDGGAASFQRTIFGSWRRAFLYRSGGFRFRRLLDRGAGNWTPVIEEYRDIYSSTMYKLPADGNVRLTVPQLMPNAFGKLGVNNEQLGLEYHGGQAWDQSFVAARDDIQLGYPILPRGVPPVSW